MQFVVAGIVAIADYFGAALLLARPSAERGSPARRLALACATLGTLLHALILLGIHRGALDLHFFAALSLVGFGIAALTLIVNLIRPVAALGVIVFPLAAILLGVDEFLAPPTIPTPLDWQIKLHVMVGLIGFSVLAIAAVLAVLLALQERSLRGRRLDSVWIRALPPLTLTESLLFRLIGAGFILLTLTLLTGMLFVQNLFAQDLVEKTVLSIIAWAVFGALLAGRRLWGWRGARAVNLTLIGMVVLALAFFGSKFVLELVLHRIPPA
ncbi:MAG: cytochrome c biogenesis protein CcsA [Lysobacterales bacterium]